MCRYNKGCISVIVPMFNAEQTIKKCIEGIQKSTYKNLEIILINDGSTDHTLNICNEYKKTDNRIIVMDKENTGAGLSRQCGMEIAKGEYLAFVDADDWPDEDMYTKMMELTRKENLDICMVGNRIHYPNGKSEERDVLFQKNIYEKDEIIKQMLRNCVWYPNSERMENPISAVWMGLYRHEIINSNGIRFYSEREYYSEDSIFNFMMLVHAKKIGFVRDSFYNFVRTGNSMSTRYDERYDKYKQWYEVVINYAKKYGVEKYIIPYINHTYCEMHHGRLETMIIKKELSGKEKKEIKKLRKDKVFRKICILKTAAYSYSMKVQLLALKYCLPLYKIIVKGRKIRCRKIDE